MSPFRHELGRQSLAPAFYSVSVYLTNYSQARSVAPQFVRMARVIDNRRLHSDAVRQAVTVAGTFRCQTLPAAETVAVELIVPVLPVL